MDPVFAFSILRVPKGSPKKSESLQNPEEHSLEELNKELNSTSGKLLETSGSLHAFTQALQTSHFKEFVDYMGRPWYSFWFNFLIGIARGLGFVVGATVVVGIVVWVISRILAQLPFVGEFFETLGDFLTEENLKSLQSGSFIENVGTLFETFKANVLDSYSQVQSQTGTPPL